MIGIGTSLLFDGDGGRKAAFHNSLVDAWFMSGYSNENPPEEVVGVKGGKMALKNFAFKLNSGFGKYNVDFKLFSYNTSRGDAEVTSSTIIIKKSTIAKYPIIYTKAPNPSFKIKITNIPEEHSLRIGDMDISEDGVYTIPVLSGGHLGFGTSTVLDSCNITITQLPSAYDGYLCFDGVDDYALWNSSPLLEDYTLICKRKWFNTDLGSTRAIASKRKAGMAIDGAFIFERIDIYAARAVNYGYTTPIEISQQDVVYQTASSYNGHYALKRGTLKDTELLSLGSAGPGYEFAQCAIAYFALYSRTLTTQEIEKEKVKLEAEWNKRLIK